MATTINRAGTDRERSFAESESGLWDSEGNPSLDPRPVEPTMYRASPDEDSAWGFHQRAELLNGRLAMLGFASGLVIEALTGQGILHQLGLAALLNQG